ncbi:MAG TPA: sigma-54 dependent transcriptional regulator [Rhodanobacteraceae bacterium]|jgi:DNA-binding NtrC family response regulator|nr:sigma-54 dependent transcriptional regulator [Rhodanobacteraceae bacterium]
MRASAAVGHVLLIEDDDGFARVVAEVARQCGCKFARARTLEQARKMAAEQGFDLLLVDITLPDGSGLELLDDLDLQSHGRIAIVTGAPSVESALRVLKSPVVDYLVKPVLAETLQQLLMEANDNAARRVALAKSAGGMIGTSHRMRELLREVERVGPTDVSVLVHGDSGTGKELVARALHHASGRSGAFVAVNCGALAQDLMGSLLFGHERGSFTGAVQSHTGYFEQAEGGTLFLDEITEMPQALQVYLLRVIETRSLTRVGGTRELPVDVRLIAATNREPRACVEAGLLRHDLYYRLSGYRIHTAPLSERREDIPLLAEHFLGELNRRYGTNKQFAPEALIRMSDAPWPGNVRELRHAVQRSYLLAHDNTQMDFRPDASPHTVSAEAGNRVNFTVGMSFEDVEREMLLKTLARCGNNKSRAARILGITSKTIYNRLIRYRAQGLIDDELAAGLTADEP